MSIVAVAILISFHLKAEASPLEKRIALPFGLVFWFLAIACLAAGLNNYIKTVSRYSRRQALVQSGTGTQLVSSAGVNMIGSNHLCSTLFGSDADGATISGVHGCGDRYSRCLCAVPVDECAE
jgi:tellurite resistance protein TehA-like permease